MAIARGVLGHVVLNVRDLKKSERFYREILGMAVSGRNRRTKMSFLSFGAEHHDIALMELPRGAQRSAGDGIQGLHHFCVYVADDGIVDKLYPILQKRGIEVVSGPEILEVARNRSVSFLDPDGNRVEVACNRNKFARQRRRRRK
jgi:catechol 2,3-dioxygenase-like lactoylglutathione lyase family enzyme